MKTCILPTGTEKLLNGQARQRDLYSVLLLALGDWGRVYCTLSLRHNSQVPSLLLQQF
ncbi:hypothetical protein [Kamptonema formosum]|uniref:hypothetical protein n=1 Tax=Kamptonema formosum TaxID=331992 RepID=UPI0012DE2739|nr:hypothetical protein [Oscillatoria sp. PCC 10802]